VSLTDVELDRLADYTVHALEPRDAAAVGHLIRTDPRWAEAYRDLVGADAMISDQLRRAASPIAMPADVARRIDAALADAAPLATVVPLAVARQARRRRIVTGIAAAAAAVVAIGGGLSLYSQTARQNATTASAPDRGMAEDSSGNLAAPSAPGSAPLGGGPRVLVSGKDYRPETLAALGPAAPPAPSPAPAAGAPDFSAKPDTSAKSVDVPEVQAIPPSLSGLPVAGRLAACLDAVRAAHPGTVTLLDYARFRTEPALIIVVRQASGGVVVAVGENCGINGADEKAAVPTA
jgi:hypothetical protein